MLGAAFINTLIRDAQRLYPKVSSTRACLLSLFNPRFHPVIIYRLAHCLRRFPLRPIGLVLSLLNWILFRVEIALDTEIGPGLFIPHGSVIIGAYRIGENFSIFSGAVIGARSGNLNCPTAPIGPDRPTIGSNTTIYANAVLVGPIQIGDNVRVAACTLVTESIPSNSVVRSYEHLVVVNTKKELCK